MVKCNANLTKKSRFYFLLGLFLCRVIFLLTRCDIPVINSYEMVLALSAKTIGLSLASKKENLITLAQSIACNINHDSYPYRYCQ